MPCHRPWCLKFAINYWNLSADIFSTNKIYISKCSRNVLRALHTHLTTFTSIWRATQKEVILSRISRFALRRGLIMIAGFSKWDFRNLGKIWDWHIFFWFFSKKNQDKNFRKEDFQIFFWKKVWKCWFFSLVTTAFWNLVTKPTAGRFNNEIPKRCCNENEKTKFWKKMSWKQNIIFWKKYMSTQNFPKIPKITLRKLCEHFCYHSESKTCKISSRFLAFGWLFIYRFLEIWKILPKICSYI